MGDGDGAPQEQGNDVGAVEQVDLFDLAYAVFRISILIAVCVTYASWQRIALVTAVGLIFYWLVLRRILLSGLFILLFKQRVA